LDYSEKSKLFMGGIQIGYFDFELEFLNLKNKD
jgi:hypothetical protein